MSPEPPTRRVTLSNTRVSRADQRKAGGEDYRLSNLLETPEKVAIGRDGTLSFTGESAFVHKGVKLTLKFSGKNTLSKDFTSMTVTGNGLYSGEASKDETVYLYHPGGTGDAKYTWHGIIAPLTSQQSIWVSVTDANGVVYDVTLTCARAANSHYTYTLTLKNNVSSSRRSGDQRVAKAGIRIQEP